MTNVTVQVKIEGRVQGVWYRGWTVQTATELGLSGWVRNCSDGSVEAVFSGTQPLINQMLEQCHIGPIAASVVSVVSNEYEFEIEEGFKQLPTSLV